MADERNDDMIEEENGVVAPIFGCPRCGERRMDWLAWTDEYGEEVECQTCAFVYSPNDA